MSIWIAAQIAFELAAMAEPAITIVGHEHSIYRIYLSEDPVSRRNNVHNLDSDPDLLIDLSTPVKDDTVSTLCTAE